jgi:hypothetical protein
MVFVRESMYTDTYIFDYRIILKYVKYMLIKW